MKLIVDNTNVETILVGNLMDIAGMSRRFFNPRQPTREGAAKPRVRK